MSQRDGPMAEWLHTWERSSNAGYDREVSLIISYLVFFPVYKTGRTMYFMLISQINFD